MKYTIHYGIRLTKNIVVEADNKETAVILAMDIADELPLEEFTFATDDYDVIEMEG